MGGSDCTKILGDLPSLKALACPWACKVFGQFRTKMFHVKHFWNHSKLYFSEAKYDPVPIAASRREALCCDLEPES
jgi:hypothetical protein